MKAPQEVGCGAQANMMQEHANEGEHGPACSKAGKPHSQEEEFQKSMALAVLAGNFEKELPAVLLDMWLDLLAPFSAVHVQAAVRQVILQYEYKTLPPFAVLKKALDELAGTGDKAVSLQAHAEWSCLLEAIAKQGRYRPPVQGHPTTMHVVRLMGGWNEVCAWPTATLDFKRRDFMALWKEAHRQLEFMALGAHGMVQALEATGPHSVAPSGVMTLPEKTSNPALPAGAGQAAWGRCSAANGLINPTHKTKEEQ